MNDLDVKANGLERRAFHVDLRQADQEARTAWVTVVTYGVVDDYGTIWEPGCFTESLRTKLPKVTWSHNWSDIIGQVIDYQDSSQRLDVLIQFSDFEAVPRARQAWTQMRDGDVDEMSFGFERQERILIEDSPDARERMIKARMHEVSPVLVGSVPNTAVLSVREKLRQAFTEEQIAELRELLVEDAVIPTKTTTTTVGDVSMSVTEPVTAAPENLPLEPGDDGSDDDEPLDDEPTEAEKQAAQGAIDQLLNEALDAEALAAQNLVSKHG